MIIIIIFMITAKMCRGVSPLMMFDETKIDTRPLLTFSKGNYRKYLKKSGVLGKRTHILDKTIQKLHHKSH